MAGFATHAQGVTFEVGGESTIADSTLTPANGFAQVPNTGANWTAAGGEGNRYTKLTSRTLTVPVAGTVTLKFSHRYNFEASWDGGAVYVKTNGGAASYVPAASFSSNGYVSDLSALHHPPYGNSNVFTGGEWVFTGQSAAWGDPASIESVCTLGTFAANDTIAVEFRGGWDDSWVEPAPNWEISSVQVTDSASTDLLNATFTAGAGGFSVTSDMGLAGPWAYAGAETCRFELDATANTSDRFKSATPGPINLNSAKLEVVVMTGTLAPGDTFSLFDLSDGSTLEGAYSSLTLPTGSWDLSGLQPGGNGQITLLDSSTWVPTAEGTYSWDVALNWSDGIPNSVGKIANLNINLAGVQTVDLNQVTTVGAIHLGDSGSSYFPVTIAPGTSGSLIMDATSGSATIARTNSNGKQDIISANISLTDNLIVSDTNGVDNDGAPYYLNISGNISGVGKSVTLSGTGAVGLTGTNTYDGGTTMNIGTLKLGPDALGTGPLTINGAKINMTSYVPLVQNNAIIVNGDFFSHYGFNSGTGPITISAAGIKISGSITLGGVISGPGDLNAFDIKYGVPNGIGTGGKFQAPITLRENQTATINGWGPMWSVLEIAGIVSDGGNGYGLAVASETNAAKLYLSAANTYSGETSAPGGNVSVGIGNNLALQNSALVLNAAKTAWFGTGVTTPTIGGLKGSTDLALACADNPDAWTTGNYNLVTALTLNPLSGTCTYSGAIANGASGMSLTKTGAGTQELAGVNTYTGNTVVNAGTLKLNDNASLKFVIGAVGVNNRIMGTGVVTLDGDFAIDLTGTAMAAGNSWTLVNVSTLTATFGTTFTVTGWTEDSNVWSLIEGGNSWRFSEADGKLTFLGGYSSWANGFTPPLSNTAPDADADYDGLANSLEYVFGTDPRYPNPGGPTPSMVGTDLVFTFTRTDDSETPDISLVVQVSTNLGDWTTIPSYTIGATTGTSTLGVMVAENDAADDTITVTIPKGSNVKTFARLKAIVNN